MPRLARITIYPCKALDGHVLDHVGVTQAGTLAGDRAYALVDAAGAPINGKRHPQVHAVRCRWDADLRGAVVRHGDDERHLGIEDLPQWVAERTGMSVELRHDGLHGFPDDREAGGPTVVSTPTYDHVGSWFGLNVEAIRLRFRTNLEFDDCETFWEDRLYGEPGNRIAFRIGEVLVHGINPCRRCVVPTRDALTGAATPEFAKRFMAERRASLPPWVAAGRFTDNAYRLAVNTIIPASEAGKTLHVGDQVSLLGPIRADR